MSRKARAASRPAPVPNGLQELPPGKIAAVATYLEMLPEEIPVLPEAEEGEGSFVALRGASARYRRLYATIGAPWLWFSRVALPDADLARIVDDSRVEAMAYVEDGRDVGLVELDFRVGGECELAFLGLVPDAIGGGRGRALIVNAIRRAFARPIGRLWLHTCTLDHPGALRFYMRAGFRPYLRALEVADDPRLDGRLPRRTAPDVPVI